MFEGSHGFREKVDFKLLVLVGDIYQIESIRYGNWFGIVPSFIPSESVFELTTPYRTSNKALVNFWSKVRNIDDDIAEVIVKNGYSSVLSEALFESHGDDEIILCLNYDGLYGINNVNRFLQSGNKRAATTWRGSIYKVGDPVLFYESERFHPVIYNNLKGQIVGIELNPNWIRFNVINLSLTVFFDTASGIRGLGLFSCLSGTCVLGAQLLPHRPYAAITAMRGPVAKFPRKA